MQLKLVLQYILNIVFKPFILNKSVTKIVEEATLKYYFLSSNLLGERF